MQNTAPVYDFEAIEYVKFDKENRNGNEDDLHRPGRFEIRKQVAAPLRYYSEKHWFA